MRPISNSRSGCFLGNLLYEPFRRRRKLRPQALPVLHALEIDAQRHAPCRRLRVVEPEPLDEFSLHVTPRIGDHHVIEGPLVRAAPGQSDYHHGCPASAAVERGANPTQLVHKDKGKTRNIVTCRPSAWMTRSTTP